MTVVKGLLSPLPVILVVAAVLLLTAGLSAGAWAWPQAWAFLAVDGGLSMAGSAALALARPASFQVRQQGLVAKKQQKQPLIDAAGLIVYVAFTLAWFAFIPLDVFRLRLLPPPS
ncbi:MAG: Isoprenylcysteine carboxyl methyltransferase [Phenylobacterium sp.]|nr:Isoprenylcysteine carboxyl methyltransferase [Phenylobacterium sp.]